MLGKNYVIIVTVALISLCVAIPCYGITNTITQTFLSSNPIPLTQAYQTNATLSGQNANKSKSVGLPIQDSGVAVVTRTRNLFGWIGAFTGLENSIGVYGVQVFFGLILIIVNLFTAILCLYGHQFIRFIGDGGEIEN